MNLPKVREIVLLGIIVLLLGIITYGGVWFNKNYVLMPVPRDTKEEVNVCIKNKVSCSLLYETKEEIK